LAVCGESVRVVAAVARESLRLFRFDQRLPTHPPMPNDVEWRAPPEAGLPQGCSFRSVR
jgi:hypothetical protein